MCGVYARWVCGGGVHRHIIEGGVRGIGDGEKVPEKNINLFVMDVYQTSYFCLSSNFLRTVSNIFDVSHNSFYHCITVD